MKRYLVEPEVAGHLGSETELDRSVHPPTAHCLHYVMDGWLGDPLLESFPCFVLTADCAEKLRKAELTGVHFAEVKISVSEQFEETCPNIILPKFKWMRIVGDISDDFALAGDGRLIVSGRGLDLLQDSGMANAEVSDTVTE